MPFIVKGTRHTTFADHFWIRVSCIRCSNTAGRSANRQSIPLNKFDEGNCVHGGDGERSNYTRNRYKRYFWLHKMRMVVKSAKKSSNPAGLSGGYGKGAVIRVVRLLLILIHRQFFNHGLQVYDDAPNHSLVIFA